MAVLLSSLHACFSYVQLNHLISLVSFCDPHTLFLFFFFCSKKQLSCETESLSTLDRLVTALSLLVCMVLCLYASLCVHA